MVKVIYVRGVNVYFISGCLSFNNVAAIMENSRRCWKYCNIIKPVSIHE